MDKIIVAFWSQSGNTQEMADEIVKGIKENGKDAIALHISEVSMADLKASEVFALGCPAMGAEVLEESEMEPFVDEVTTFANGKKIALFGSYGWGDGEWMRNWEEQMRASGATLIGGEGFICQETPSEEAKKGCYDFGKQIANA